MVFAVGTVLSAGFYVIGLNYWLLVGAFVGLIEIVPVIGPVVGSILVLAVGLPQSLQSRRRRHLQRRHRQPHQHHGEAEYGWPRR